MSGSNRSGSADAAVGEDRKAGLLLLRDDLPDEVVDGSPSRPPGVVELARGMAVFGVPDPVGLGWQWPARL